MARKRRRRADDFTIRTRFIVKLVETGDHVLIVHGGFAGEQHTEWIPLADVDSDRLLRFIANRFGATLSKHDPRVATLRDRARLARRVLGTARQGWTENCDAFVFGRKIYRISKTAPKYRFVSLTYQRDDTLHAVTPVGSRSEQYEALKTLWQRSQVAQLVLGLACICPFLKPIDAPTIVLHLSGGTGIGKTTLLRIAASLFLNPDSPLVAIDFSKDTDNSIDEKLGNLRHFPIVVDETTGADADRVTKFLYGTPTGKTRGRLRGSDFGYRPAGQSDYDLVCFMSGERPRRQTVTHGGGAARLMELELRGSLFSRKEIASWWALPRHHSGWFGRDLLGSVIKTYIRPDASLLKGLYDATRQSVAARLASQAAHPRMIDMIALVELGHYFAAHQLFDDFRLGFRFKNNARWANARYLADWTFQHLAKDTTVHQIEDAIAEVPGISAYLARGFIPKDMLDSVAKDYDLTNQGALARYLRSQGLITGYGGRKIKTPEGGDRQNAYCYILSPEGKKRLLAA